MTNPATLFYSEESQDQKVLQGHRQASSQTRVRTQPLPFHYPWVWVWFLVPLAGARTQELTLSALGHAFECGIFPFLSTTVIYPTWQKADKSSMVP